MGRLLPDDFDLSSLKNDSERLVVRALCERLTDGWVVLPSVGFAGDRRDFEIDVVIAHERDGVAVVEVKGHRSTIRGGTWYSGSDPMKPQPFDQARDNAHELARRLRKLHPSLARIQVEYAVAFPNIAEIRGSLPPDIDRAQVLTSESIDDIAGSIGRLLTFRHGNRVLGEAGLRKLTEMLRPDCEVQYDAEIRARLARAKLDAICEQQVGALQGLDVNRRVCVTGAAGTGKTRLATTWVRRALLRGERVLLTCFNRPLAARLRERMPECEELWIDAFWDVALHLDGMPPLHEPESADQSWWDGVALDHLRSHWDAVTTQFDTIVIDEAQDFRPDWISLIERLFDPAGPRRLLTVADESQAIYGRDFRVPDPDTGWTLCELASNCRNTSAIANLLRNSFGGARVPIGGPESEDLTWIEADDVEAAIEAVGDAIDDILDTRDHSAPSVLVATCTRSVRDRIRDELGCASFDDAGPLDIVCETAHRAKGLEYDHVILVVHDDTVSDEILYVGISRAVMSLTIIGPTGLGERIRISARAS